MDITLLLIVCAAAYLLGSINTSILVAKVYGVDIRAHGSGNAGMTNALRVLGKKAAVFVLIGDILKGVIAISVATLLVNISANLLQGIIMFDMDIYKYAAGFFVVLGHNFPVYFKFKGGKGILSTATVVAILHPKLFLCLLALFVVIVAITRYVSLGSVCAAAALVVIPLFTMRDNPAFIVFAAVTGVLAIFMHRSNILRLVQGSENKLGAKKKKTDNTTEQPENKEKS